MSSDKVDALALGLMRLTRVLNAAPSSAGIVTGQPGTTIETSASPARALRLDTTRGEAMSTPGIFSQRPLGAVDPSVLTDEQKQRFVAWDVVCRTAGEWEEIGVSDLVCLTNFLVDGLGGYQVTYDTLYPPLTAQQRADLNHRAMVEGGLHVHLGGAQNQNSSAVRGPVNVPLYEPGDDSL